MLVLLVGHLFCICVCRQPSYQQPNLSHFMITLSRDHGLTGHAHCSSNQSTTSHSIIANHSCAIHCFIYLHLIINHLVRTSSDRISTHVLLHIRHNKHHTTNTMREVLVIVIHFIININDDVHYFGAITKESFTRKAL